MLPFGTCIFFVVAPTILSYWLLGLCHQERREDSCAALGKHSLVFQHLSVAAPQARCTKLCSSWWLLRKSLLQVLFQPQELQLPLCPEAEATMATIWSKSLAQGWGDFSVWFLCKQCECSQYLFWLPCMAFEHISLVQLNLKEGQRAPEQLAQRDGRKPCPWRHSRSGQMGF